MTRRDRPPRGYRFVAALVVAVSRLLRWRIDARGLDRLPAGGVVVTWNHTSHVDFAVTALPIHLERRRMVRFLALRSLWDRPVLGWLFRRVRCIPVERGSEDGRAAALDEAVAALRAGDLVMVAPEGTISRSGDLLPFRTGAVRMAQAAGVPVVPTASWGSHRFATTGRPASVRRGWRLPVTVRVGEPLAVPPDDDPVAATAELRRRTQALLDEARAAVPR